MGRYIATARRIACKFGAGLAIAGACAFPAVRATAGGGPENVFLVVNDRGTHSKEVANHYAALRQIAPSNVFYLPAPPNANQMSGIDFRDKLLRPVLAEIDKRGLRDQIDQIVYSCEFPWQINFGPMFAGTSLPPERRPTASLTGATFLYQFVEQDSPNLTQLNSNFYYVPVSGGSTVSRAFHARERWGPGGLRAAGGVGYLLATQLGSTAGGGNTAAEIVAYLKRAATIDGKRPAGTFYYMKNNDRRSLARHDLFDAAARELNALGAKARVMTGVVPTGQGDILGLTTGAAQVSLRTGNCVLLPGALVDNLTSAGGQLARSPGPGAQTKISEYLRLGAAGASGTVVEPFAIAAKFPAPQLHVHYVRGCSMAEAFYQSVQGPFQLLVLGDPLCQPWAHIPEVSVEGIADGATASQTIEIVPSAKLASGRAVARYELFVDGVRSDTRPPGEKFSLDTAKLADGHHELRVVAIDNTPIETAGRWIGNVIVKNGREAVSVSSVGASRVSASEVTLSVRATVDAPVAVFHNGRELGRAQTRQATLQVPAARLGKGPVEIEARTLRAPILRSRPLKLEIL